eukprot:TRINITY_DN6893_c0_g1_i2.p1 TRINITY_DN6893_c0_g1~~TRINITY_DN6893_c0_g1_i2.p1  ORF type:complete len:351 (+),score=55.98 TRINITY_DN6893_c0_g1_i2:180-1232(+)
MCIRDSSTGWAWLDEVAGFWEDYLVKFGRNFSGSPIGSYSSVNDCFNEICSSDPDIVNANPHITLSLLRFLFPVFIDAATALNNTLPARIALWEHLHSNLAPLPLVVLSDNRTIFGGVQGSTNHPETGSNPLNTYLGWPGWDDSLGTDDGLRKVLADTLDYMQSWSCGNCWPQYPAARVRVQDRARDANTTWNAVQAALTKSIGTNLIVADGPDNWTTAMEGAAGIGIVNELLIQSHDLHAGIAVFPQVPSGQPAAFERLRARGGLLVSASMSSSGEVSNVHLANDRKDGGSGNVTLLSPWWPERPAVRIADETTGDAWVVAADNDGRVSFVSHPGERYALDASGGSMTL